MWDLHAMLAETREQDLRRQVRERYLAQQAIEHRRRPVRRGQDAPAARRRADHHPS
jgi:hypothetical protein